MRVLMIIAFAGLMVFTGCHQDEETLENGTLLLSFAHLVNDNPAEYDQMIYENAAGNVYELTNIQWFVSDLTLVKEDGSTLLIEGDNWIHYIDSDIPESQEWELNELIPPGEYASIKFTFGIKGEKNQPNMFTDPPESNMLWPYHMGGDMGGYHYMKLNGFWIDENQERTPFNFHIGVGQEYDENGEVIAFIQNWFETVLPASAFTMNPGETLEATLQMSIENWFKNPHIYDHDVFGGKIMNNQEAMGMIKDNGMDVFSIEINNSPETAL